MLFAEILEDKYKELNEFRIKNRPILWEKKSKNLEIYDKFFYKIRELYLKYKNSSLKNWENNIFVEKVKKSILVDIIIIILLCYKYIHLKTLELNGYYFDLIGELEKFEQETTEEYKKFNEPYEKLEKLENPDFSKDLKENYYKEMDIFLLKLIEKISTNVINNLKNYSSSLNLSKVDFSLDLNKKINKEIENILVSYYRSCKNFKINLKKIIKYEYYIYHKHIIRYTYFGLYMIIAAYRLIYMISLQIKKFNNEKKPIIMLNKLYHEITNYEDHLYHTYVYDSDDPDYNSNYDSE